MKKLIGIFVCMLLMTIIIPASASYKDNKIVGENKLFYPIVKIEWNSADTKLEWINSGLLRGLLSIDEVGGTNYAIVFWSKYKVDYGTINIGPLVRPEFVLVQDDIITWNFAAYSNSMIEGNIWSLYAFGVIIEKAS